jgi:hypothetical protein
MKTSTRERYMKMEKGGERWRKIEMDREVERDGARDMEMKMSEEGYERWRALKREGQRVRWRKWWRKMGERCMEREKEMNGKR